MRRLTLCLALLTAAAACRPTEAPSEATAPVAPVAPVAPAAPVALPMPPTATPTGEPSVTAQDGQNFTVSAPGRLQIVGSEELYEIVLPTDVLFDFDRAELRPEAAPLLAQLREHFRTHRADQLHVVGHTDARGEDQYNFRLSLRRAGAVCAWLRREAGVQTTNCIGMGEQEPVAANANADGSDNPLNRQLNRRVNIRVVAYPDISDEMAAGQAAGAAARDAIAASRRERGLE